MAGNSTESGRSVTSKITSILMTFTEGSEHSLTEIARLAGLPISTAHRLTSELASWRLLERTEDGHYRAGLPLRMIGTADACPPSIAERAPCVLEDLAAATTCRVRLGVLRELEVAYIEKEPGPRPVDRVLRGGHAARAPDRARPGAARVLPDRHRRDDDHARPAALHRAHDDLAGPVPARAGGDPADPGRGHPAGAGAGSCGVAMPVFGPGGEVVAAIEVTVRDLGQRPAADAGAAVHRLPQPVPRAGRRARPGGTPGLPDPAPADGQPGSRPAGHPGGHGLTHPSSAAPSPEHGAVPDERRQPRTYWPGASPSTLCLRLPSRGGFCSAPELSADHRAQSSHQVPLRRSATPRQASPVGRQRVLGLGDHVPGLGPGRADDAGDVPAVAEHEPDRPGHQADGLVGRLPGHDVVVDRADHVGRRLDRAQVDGGAGDLQLGLRPACSARRSCAGRTRASRPASGCCRRSRPGCRTRAASGPSASSRPRS